MPRRYVAFISDLKNGYTLRCGGFGCGCQLRKTTAANILSEKRLICLDGPFKEVAEAVAKGGLRCVSIGNIKKSAFDDLRVIVRRVLDYVSAEAANEDRRWPL